MGGSSFPGDLYILTGKFTGGIHLIWYLLPLTSAKLLQVILSGTLGDLNPALCSLNSNGRCLWKELASPHLASLMEFRWQELTTYGKPIRDCIRSDLLSPVSAIFHHFGHYLHTGIRLGLTLNGLGCLLMSEFGENSDDWSVQYQKAKEKQWDISCVRKVFWSH